MRPISFILPVAFLAIVIAGCSHSPESNAGNSEAVYMKLSSSSFADNGMIPAKFTCNGVNVNPELSISAVPSSTKSLALIVDDPDAVSKVWVHWVVFNITPGTERIAEDSVPAGAVQGTTDFQTAKYGGPCPQSGTHRYLFTLYALDNTLDLDSSATKKDVESAMQGHIVAQAALTGLYKRQK